MSEFLIMIALGAGGVALVAIGFLAGWLLEWRIDLGYWRTYFEESAEEDQAAKAVVVLPATAAPPQLPPSAQELFLQASREQLTQRDADLSALRATVEQLNANEAHWREREAQLMDEARGLRTQIDELNAGRNDAEVEWRHELARREQQWQESKEAELAGLRADKQAYQDKLAEVEKRFAQYKTSHPAGLAAINGIGPKLEEQLSQAGIDSYADLAARTPEELQLILNPPPWRKLDYAAWIVEAKQLALRDGENTD